MKRLVFALAILACDKPESHPPDADAPQATATATATATVTAKASASANALMSKVGDIDWPVFLPDYPGATVVTKTSDPTSGKYESLDTKDARDKVAAYYRSKLGAAGFPQGAVALPTTPNASTVISTSKGSMMVIITITPNNGNTHVTISLPP